MWYKSVIISLLFSPTWFINFLSVHCKHKFYCCFSLVHCSVYCLQPSISNLICQCSPPLVKHVVRTIRENTGLGNVEVTVVFLSEFASKIWKFNQPTFISDISLYNWNFFKSKTYLRLGSQPGSQGRGRRE